MATPEHSTQDPARGGSAARHQASPAAKATPMVQRTVSSRSMRATRRAGANAGKHSRSRRRDSQHHVSIVAFVAVAVAVMVAVGLFLTRTVLDKGDDGTPVEPGLEVTVNIPDGSGGEEIANILLEAGVITDASSFFKELRNQEAESSMKSGTYDFVTGGNVKEVVRQLVEGPNSSADVITIPEGYTVAQVAAAAEKQFGIPADDFLSQAKASNYVNDFTFLSEASDDSLEGFLFPKTYDLGGKEKTADVIIRMMLSQYQSEIAAFDYESARSDVSSRYGIEMSDYDFLVLASIIEKEAISGDDWTNVSSVFYNRLADSMPLQSDATMGYVTGGEVSAEDLEIESPYNSYHNEGLVPTPICNPSITSIDAALHPGDTDYYYFLIIENGEYSNHTFSESYDDHLAAIDKALADQGQ